VMGQPAPLHSSNPDGKLFDSTIIIKYKEGVLGTWDPQVRSDKMKLLAAALRADHGLIVIRTLPILGVQQFKLGAGTQLNNVILAVRQDPNVEFADYNYRVVGAQSPNDPKWRDGHLWGLAKIQMDSAWRVRSTASEIKIAVIDSGINYKHKDLKNNMVRNNGRATCGSNSSDPFDKNGHGSMVAGVIGAEGNNSFGGVGVAWDITLIAIKSLCSEGSPPSGSVADAVDAIEYAISKDAHILNNSWRVLPPVDLRDLRTLEVAVRRTNCEGIRVPPGCRPSLFIAAAGNGLVGEDRDSDKPNGKVYPANFSARNIIAVAASDTKDDLWSNSHYGITSVHIASPGVDIESTFLGETGYSGLDGTSLAAPHVTGCAALLLAKRNRDVSSLKSAILDGSDQVENLRPYITNGRRLNCSKALSR
jgi:subtilisin family serine protease